MQNLACPGPSEPEGAQTQAPHHLLMLGSLVDGWLGVDGRRLVRAREGPGCYGAHDPSPQLRPDAKASLAPLSGP